MYAPHNTRLERTRRERLLFVVWRGVTVRHLLTHTSGIKDFADLADTETERSKDYTKAQIIALVSGAPLEFRPGQKWNYSNTGYFLLGMIIERVSRKTCSGLAPQRPSHDVGSPLMPGVGRFSFRMVEFNGSRQQSDYDERQLKD